MLMKIGFVLLICFSLTAHVYHQDGYVPDTETSITASLGQAFDINVGQVATISPQQLSVKFLSVSEDSRCPKGTNCIWEGNGKVNIQLTSQSQTSETVELNTSMSLPSEATYLTYNISLLDLKPYPLAGSTIQQSEYIATVSVSTGT
ncbi:MAG: hypothetical protein PVF44_04715 [Syntrophobacterales bacterium]|jgi:hypothetical protein